MKAIHRHSDRGMMLAATLTAGTLLAQQVGSKAVRDALFLSRFPVTALPMIVFATAIFSVGASVLAARLLTKHGPHKVIPWTFVTAAARPREEVLADLLRSNESIALNLLALRRKDPRP